MTSATAIAQHGSRGAAVRHSLGSLVVLGGLVGLLSGCSTSLDRGEGDTAQGNGELVPKAEPRSRSGNMATYVVRGKRYYTKGDSKGHIETGVASWYGPGFHGRKTSSGERYDMHAMTAAHKTLPLPTYALVTNLDNGQSAVVRINDRGPFHGPRVIDLSKAAAARVGVLAKGTARVEVRTLEPGEPTAPAPNAFLASADKPQPRVATQSSGFLDGFDAPGPAAPSPASVARPDRDSGQALAATLVSPRVAPAAPTATKPNRELVVARRDAPRDVPRSRPEPLERPVKAARDEAQVAGIGKGAKGALAKSDGASRKPGAEPKAANEPKAAKEDKVAKDEKVEKQDKAAGGMYVQVGAFGDRSNAEQLRKRLSKELDRMQVQVQKIGRDSAPLYKVQVGPFASRAKASSASQQLAALGVGKSHVVVQ